MLISSRSRLALCHWPSLKKEELLQLCTFGGDQHQLAKQDKCTPVDGVAAMVHGHFWVDEPLASANRIFIDTLEPTGRPTILSAKQVVELVASLA